MEYNGNLVYPQGCVLQGNVVSELRALIADRLYRKLLESIPKPKLVKTSEICPGSSAP